MIPQRTRIFGLLPAGVHDATWEEMVSVFGNSDRRKHLLVGLRAACINLHESGVKYLFLDGSFVTEKKSPNDWDACYSGIDVDASKLDPVWSDFKNERAAQKTKYYGEAFVAETNSRGLLGPPFLEFFQTDRNGGRKKGILRLDLGTIK